MTKQFPKHKNQQHTGMLDILDLLVYNQKHTGFIYNIFDYTWSSLPLSELLPEVVLETTPLPEVVLVSKYSPHNGTHSMANTCKKACIDNTLTRT